MLDLAAIHTSNWTLTRRPGFRHIVLLILFFAVCGCYGSNRFNVTWKFERHTSQRKFSAAIKGRQTVNVASKTCGHESIHQHHKPRKPVLDENGQLNSELWIDQPDALTQLDMRRKAGFVNVEEAHALRHMIDHGYMTVDLSLGEEVTNEFDRFLREVWRTRPNNLSAKHSQVSNGAPISLSLFPEDWVNVTTGMPRLPGTKIREAHSHSEMLQSLLHHPKIFRLVELIYDDVAVATQSLLFSHGSEQSLHRDPWYVPTNPASSMIASWVAIEDILPGSGPLIYIPDSHRLPWTLLSSNDITFDGAPKDDIANHVSIMHHDIERNGLKHRRFYPRRGEALLWHSGLVHGGAECTKPSRTRKSFVVHYDKLRYHMKKEATVTTGDGTRREFHSRKITEHNCLYAFADPLLEV